MQRLPALTDWSKNNSEALNRSWTVIGKGPSFTKIMGHPLEESVGLNHVWRTLDTGQRLTALHIFDLDVLESTPLSSLDKFQFLWIPDYLNISIRPGKSKNVLHQKDWKPAAERLKKNPLVLRLLEEDRIFTYRRGSTDSPLGGERIRTGAFSGSTVIALLATLGVKKNSAGRN